MISPSMLPGRTRPITRAILVTILLVQAFTAAGGGQQAVQDQFDVREATIEGVHNALFAGLTTCRGVVSSFLSRIEAFNPRINAVIGLDPAALSVADELDAALAAGNATVRGRLFCIPILLKDNYDAAGLNTTGGCLDLADSRAATDAPTVRAFRDEGGIVLGKVNLHELALEGLTVSSLGGQTLNPYDFTRTPGGSSGGTGAAVATSLAVFGTGTDTVNSLRSPASANSLVSVRPTRGLISRTGVIPISYTQDTVGPIARNIKDSAAALTVMASVGYDEADNATALAPPGSAAKDYSADLNGGGLQGLRLGALEGFWNRAESSETIPVNEAMDSMLNFLRSKGAQIVNVTDPLYDASALNARLDVQRYEYRQLLNAYLSGPNLEGSAPASFAELYASGRFLVIPSEYEFVTTAQHSSTGNASYPAVQLAIQNLTVALRSTFASHNLDALVYPEQKNLVVKTGAPSQSGRNGILAALTGSPVVTVAAGFSQPSADAPLGVPIGMEILGLPFTEGRLLNIAAHVTHARPARRMPAFASSMVETRSYSSVPVVKPDGSGIPSQYPIGALTREEAGPSGRKKGK